MKVSTKKIVVITVMGTLFFWAMEHYGIYDKLAAMI